jgi:hypothetical protein
MLLLTTGEQCYTRQLFVGTHNALLLLKAPADISVEYEPLASPLILRRHRVTEWAHIDFGRLDLDSTLNIFPYCFHQQRMARAICEASFVEGIAHRCKG